MNTVNKTYLTKLKIYIAENGKRLAKKKICEKGGFSEATLNKNLREGHFPDFAVRLGIYKATGIKLYETDDFPPLSEIAS